MGTHFISKKGDTFIMKAVILLANGFEECEALVPADVLRRAGAEVVLVSIGDSLSVTGAHNITVMADILISDFSGQAPDVLILPGGLDGTEAIAASYQSKGLIELAVGMGAYVAAICAAPSVLGRMGLLDGRKIACYPGFEKYMPAANVTGAKVETDDIFITAEGMGVSLEFALKITELLFGAEIADKIADQIRKA